MTPSIRSVLSLAICWTSAHWLVMRRRIPGWSVRLARHRQLRGGLSDLLLLGEDPLDGLVVLVRVMGRSG